MAIITSVALALLAQGPVEAVPGPQAGYDVGYEELVANDNRAARQAIENCDELAAADPARPALATVGPEPPPRCFRSAACTMDIARSAVMGRIEAAVLGPAVLRRARV